MWSLRVERHVSSFIALQVAQALALIPTFDFFWFLIDLALPLRSDSPGECSPSLEYACVCLTSMYPCSCGPAFYLHTYQSLEANSRKHHLCGSLAIQQNSLSHRSCLLSVVNSWKWKETTQLAIVTWLQNFYLILAILNHTGPRDTKYTSSAVTDLLVFIYRCFFLCVLTAAVWCCSSKCNKRRTRLRWTIFWERSSCVMRQSSNSSFVTWLLAFGQVSATCLAFPFSSVIVILGSFSSSLIW